MREAAYFGAELEGVLARDFGEIGSNGIAVIAVDNGAAGTAGAENAVVAGDERNGLHAKGDDIVDRGGPAQLSQIVAQRKRGSVIAETQVGNAEIANHGRRKRVGVGDYSLAVIKGFR